MCSDPLMLPSNEATDKPETNMASKDSFIMREKAARTVVAYASGADTPVAFYIQYKGTGTISGVVLTTGTGLILTTSDGGAESFPFATYATIGAVVDAINASSHWRARSHASLRSAASVSRLLGAPTTYSATTDESGKSVYAILLDTSTALQYAVCLTPRTTFDANSKQRRVRLQEIKYAIDVGAAAVDSVQVWQRRIGNGMAETQLLSRLSVDTTATTLNFAGGYGSLDSLENSELIVIVKDAATLADNTANILEATAKIE